MFCPPNIGVACEVAPGVRWLRLPLPFALDHINAWILEGEGLAVLVETVLNDVATIRCWEDLCAINPVLAGARRIKALVAHHHPDHLGMAGTLTRRLQATLHTTAPEHGAAQRAIARASAVGPDALQRWFRHRSGWSRDQVAQRSALDVGLAETVSAVDAIEPPLRRCIDGGIVRAMATGEAIACLNYLIHREGVVVDDDTGGVTRYRRNPNLASPPRHAVTSAPSINAP